jgi:hypothetical protein
VGGADALSELPGIDEHSILVAAHPEAALDAALEVMGRGGAGTRAVTRLLGCRDMELPGFRVASSNPSELALEGSHRFSSYSLTFRAEATGEGASLLRAESHAAFPGLTGRAYRALVVGSGGHRVAMRRLLGAIKRRAER